MNPFRHRHTWTPIEVEHTRMLVAGYTTLVLRSCRCGDHDVEALTGNWPKELFMPARAEIPFAPPPMATTNSAE